MKRIYHPGIRQNDPLYLKRQAEELLNISLEFNGVNEIFYACLDLRIALEILDLTAVLTSVDENERILVIENSKPKNGIDKEGRKHGVLKKQYQMFFQAVCETVEIPSKCFEFKKSKDLQFDLSSYIHSYYMSNEDLDFNSPFMQRARELIIKVIEFINSSIVFTDTTAYVVGIEVSTLPAEDKLLLEEWKNSPSMDYEILKLRIKENIDKRT